MLLDHEMVHFDYSVQETGLLTTNEIQELLSLFQSPADSPNSGSEGSNPAVSSPDERKQRRIISNRESARRSRWRKKRHLENLTVQADRLKVENHELKNRLGSVLNNCHVLWRENYRLKSESVALQARLSNLCRVFVAMHANDQRRVQ